MPGVSRGLGRRVSPRRDDRGVVAQFLLFLVVSVLSGVLAAGLALPALGALGLAARGGVETFESLPAELETPPLPQRSRILDAENGLVAEFYYENRVTVPLRDVAPVMRNAMLAIEDSRFYEHAGVDLRGTTRAFVNNTTGDTVQGGSTLTQQYVKLVLLDQAVESGDEEAASDVVSREGIEGISRKVREMRMAMALEQRLGKDEILERYLNQAYFGAGAYGVESAAQRFFHVRAKKLTLPQAAMIAGLVQSPGAYDPIRNPERAKARRDAVLARMAELGYITQEERLAARATDLGLRVRDFANGCATSQAPFYCDFVMRRLLADPAFGETRADRVNRLLRGGLVIRTALAPEVQQGAQEAVDSHLPRDDQSGFATAIAMVKPGDGAILAMAQNRNWGESDGDPSTTQINYAADYADGGSIGFQAGSTFKPFVIQAALQKGLALQLRVPTPAEKEYERGEFTDCEGNPLDEYTVGNSTSTSGLSTMDMYGGIAGSINTWAVELERMVGWCDTTRAAQTVGVARADGQPVGDPARAGGSFILGADEVSPLTMAEAYATWAARGLHCEPYAVVSVTDRDGNVIEPTREPCTQVIDQDVADGVNEALEGVLTGDRSFVRTGRPMALDRPAAGKTGTTSDNYDVWFAGYTPDLAAAVWLGDPGRVGADGDLTRRKIRNVEINGRYVSSGYGGSLAGPIWKDAMEHALEGVPPTDFVDPSEEVRRGVQVQVPDVRGMSEQSALEALREAGLAGRVAGDRVPSQGVDEGRVAYSSPGAGRSIYSGTLVTLHISNGRAPRRDPEPEWRRADEPRRQWTPQPEPASEPEPVPVTDAPPAQPRDGEAAPEGDEG